MFRRALDRRVAGVILLGAFPGALLGSLVAIAIPEAARPWLLLAVAALAVARELGWVRWDPSPRALGPLGFASGAIAATSGGMAVSPMLLAAGVRGDALIGTASATAMTVPLPLAVVQALPRSLPRGGRGGLAPSVSSHRARSFGARARAGGRSVQKQLRLQTTRAGGSGRRPRVRKRAVGGSGSGRSI
jgi:hypothetical protein